MRWLRRLLASGLAAACCAGAGLSAAEPVADEPAPPPEPATIPAPPADPPLPPELLPPGPRILPKPGLLTPPEPRRPVAGVQEGPYYRTDSGAAGLLFEVSRTFEGIPLSRWALDLSGEYAWDRHRGDGGLGDWRAVRGILRYREVSVQAAYDDRRFGPARAVRFQGVRLLYGGVVAQGHAKPFHDGGFGVRLWWPQRQGNTGDLRVIPEVGFRATLARWPAYPASLAAFRRGEPQVASAWYMAVEMTGSAAWNFKSIEGWVYDGGVRWVIGAGSWQASAGYQIWGLRKHVGQGPSAGLTLLF